MSEQRRCNLIALGWNVMASVMLGLIISTHKVNAQSSVECDFSDPELYTDALDADLSNCLDRKEINLKQFRAISKLGDAWDVERAIWSMSDTHFDNALQNDQNGTPLIHSALENSDPEVIVTLAWYGFDLMALTKTIDEGWLKSTKGTSALHSSFKNNDHDHAAILISLLAFNDVEDASGKTPDQYATGFGNELFSVAIGLNAESDGTPTSRYRRYTTENPDRSCEHFLTDEFFKEATLKNINKCLDTGSSVLGSNTHGDTAFHVAARNTDDVAVIGRLIASFQDFTEVASSLNKRNLKGNTPLHEASLHNDNANILTRLLYWGAELEAKNNRGQTSLHLAAKRGDRYAVPIIARLLASSDASGWLNVRVPLDNKGNSPLHFAAQNDAHGVMSRMLLMAGFEPDLRNNDGITPLMIAAENKMSDIKNHEDKSSSNFTDVNQIGAFLDYLSFSEKPCEPIPDKYSERAGQTILDIAKRNPSLLISDNSGKVSAAIQELIDRCS